MAGRIARGMAGRMAGWMAGWMAGGMTGRMAGGRTDLKRLVNRHVHFFVETKRGNNKFLEHPEHALGFGVVCEDLLDHGLTQHASELAPFLRLEPRHGARQPVDEAAQSTQQTLRAEQTPREAVQGYNL